MDSVTKYWQKYPSFLSAKKHHRVDHAFGQTFQKTSSGAPLRLSGIENVRSAMPFSIQGATTPHIDNVWILCVLGHCEPMLGCSVRSALPLGPPCIGHSSAEVIGSSV